jgi:hypothetical protein
MFLKQLRAMPVQITGLDEVPEGGQIIQVFPTLEAAREKTQAFQTRIKQ